ncbi:MAG: multidrug ABC transporter substrate-binding protein [Betaproteobacteria bacterium RIFCSPLOWO2_02_FULL_65_24]|nr:MAG: multidrug ABC transporter substrate-binding protein [Betaproteobacteria bacterium RIFCSPLOWO2_02_FULL_65_24]OGA86331.1 MAG: multidrug ABC transporter substrate-binding protein [Betaproteobacteria bacterium RIFCSPLOWO2_12_FULL_66_14]
MDYMATLRVALRALKVNAMRSTLTMLGIIIGVAAVITMIAVGRGAQTRVEDQIKSLGSNLMIVMPGSTTTSGVRMGAGGAQTLTEDDATAIARDIDEVQVAAPTLRGSGQLVAGNINWSTGIQGVTPDYLEAREWRIESGRGFEAAEIAGAGKVAILGQTTARELFGDADPLDQTIRIRRVPFTVIGILEKKGQTHFGQDQDDIVMVPIATHRNRLFGAPQGKLRRVGQISVKVREGMNMQEAEERVRELMRQRHRLAPGQEDDFSIRNLAEILQTREASSRVLTLLLAAVASVSLLVGGIGIMNIMLVSVTERTREIGLRMAVGARARDILSQFLVEALVLALTGGLIGIVLGVGGSIAIGEFAGWRVQLTAGAIALAAGSAALVGVFFGFYPARKAARLSPIEALRFE